MVICKCALYFLRRWYTDNRLIRQWYLMSMYNGGMIPFCLSLHYHSWFVSSSEGIQIGNVGSAAGIVGAWTGATHDEGLFHSRPWVVESPHTSLTIYRRTHRWAHCLLLCIRSCVSLNLQVRFGCGKFPLTIQAICLTRMASIDTLSYCDFRSGK
jgi:hypothetical protein